VEHSKTVAAFWDRQTSAEPAKYWTDYPVVRRYVNECVTDAWWAYPTHGFKAAWAYRPLERGLSIGCGTGLLERDLRWLRICEEVDAYDLSAASIEAARRRAEIEGFDRVNFAVADCERFDYPEDRYDVVFFHGSMHHISDPAALLDRILPALREGGLLFLDDYVGPSRDEWSDADLSFAQEAYETLPDPWRRMAKLLPPFDSTDPSEMARSSAILPAVHDRFHTLWERPYWGNVLFPVLCHVDDRLAARPESEETIARLIARERQLVREGKLRQPLFVWFVGRKRAAPVGASE
jgi:SAM-dependent methyltransferase